jgi:acetylornithine/succinyldiaminopimelate/putrescine aminotransferase
MEGNFHGRTTTIVSFSTDSDATHDYAPYTPGFRLVPYGDIEALRAAIDETTVAVLLEPVQGEAGVVIPPDGYLQDVRALCRDENVLMVADEIQSGWPAPAAPSRATTRTSSPTCTSSARRSAAGSTPCRPWPPTATCSA